MLRKLLVTGFCAVGLLAGTAGTADASFLRSVLSNGANTLEDQDREAYIDADVSNTISVGDVLVGFARIDEIDDGTPPAISLDNQVYTIFTQQVSSTTPDGSDWNIEFIPTTLAGLTLQDLTGDSNTAGGFSAVYSSAAGIVNLITTSPGDLDANGVINIFDYFQAITDNMTLDLVAGFGDADDFIQAEADSLDTSNIATTPNSVTVANFDAGLSITYNADPAIIFHESVLSSRLTLHDLVVANGAARGAVGQSNSEEWTNVNPNVLYDNPGGFATDADFFVNVTVIPEPTSFALLALGVAGMGGLSIRRRKTAQPVA